ncbi:hypothetical protein MMRN_31900 [Mycobacterium marinum]|nr:hypothetical protein MMRN_31900 [Mycobacterium marinum]
MARVLARLTVLPRLPRLPRLARLAILAGLAILTGLAILAGLAELWRRPELGGLGTEVGLPIAGCGRVLLRISRLDRLLVLLVVSGRIRRRLPRPFLAWLLPRRSGSHGRV